MPVSQMTKKIIQNREALGWDAWFDRQAGSFCEHNVQVARVIAVDRDQFLLLNETGSFRGKLSGKFRFESSSPDQLPCVGDWVCVARGLAGEFSLIHAALERKTQLRRKAVGQSSDYQIVAANMDVVFIVQSCHYDFNLNRLERYLVMVAEGGAAPHIILTKMDLVTSDVLTDQFDQIRKAGIDEPVLALSNVTQEGVEGLYYLLSRGKTYCFVGSSGVGKSTIINGLLGREMLETKDVSGTGEGKHTTVRRELIMLDNGAMVIDGPGMREFGVSGSAGDINAGFTDITNIASGCRFRDCTHTSEPGCAVLEALEEGKLSHERFDNFVKLRKESKLNQMSQAQKRKRDRQFGKFMKTAKKDFYRE